MNSSSSILVVDDDAQMAGTLSRLLTREGFTVLTATSAAEAEQIVANSSNVALALIDLVMPMVDGMALLERLKQQRPELAVLMMSGFGTVPSIVEAIKRGAVDFITKPFERATILAKVNHILELQSLRQKVSELEKSQQPHSFSGLIAQAPRMLRALQLSEAASRTDVPVLLIGETGTGKERLARLIHQNSDRAARPFIPVNCGALPRELVESELFGHRKGSFTGAQQDRPGLFMAGSGGTLLLDEIGEMPAEAQVKLLRALQEGKVRPVGGVEEMPVDVRVIAATNRPTMTNVSGSLRQDLYFRLARIIIELPPLRERREDLPVLLDHFLGLYATKYKFRPTFAPDALDLLSRYPFPGNIRELDNLVEGVMATHEGEPVIHERELRPYLHPDLVRSTEEQALHPSVLSLERLEKYAIEQALRLSRGNKRRACGILGISPDSLYRKMKQYGIPL